MFVRVSQLAILASVIGSFALASPADAQDNYPVDAVTLVTHSSPGGGSDVYLREVINFLAPTMGAEFAVENVRGGSGAKAIAKVATSPADGSIFYAATPTYINMSLLSNPEYSYRDVEPIVNFFLDPQVIYVRKDSKYTSLTDVIADAKASPGAAHLQRDSLPRAASQGRRSRRASAIRFSLTTDG